MCENIPFVVVPAGLPAETLSSLSTLISQMATLSEENSALRAKVETLTKQAYQYHDATVSYYGTATELLAVSKELLEAVKENYMDVAQESLGYRYQRHGGSWEDYLSEKQRQLLRKSGIACRKATTSLTHISRAVASAGQPKKVE